jgi:hypothetical protein
MGKYIDVRLVTTLVVTAIVWYFVSPMIMKGATDVEEVVAE